MLNQYIWTLTFGSVIMASSSTVPVTQGSVVTSRDFLSGWNWMKNEHTVNLHCSFCFFKVVFDLFLFVNLRSKHSFLWKLPGRHKACYCKPLWSLPLIQSMPFLAQPYSCLVFLLLKLLWNLYSDPVCCREKKNQRQIVNRQTTKCVWVGWEQIKTHILT